MQEFDFKKIQSGNLNAFRPFFEYYFKVLRHYVTEYIDDGETADDIVQESMVKLWERKSRFNDCASAVSFLFTVCRNISFNVIKHRKTVLNSAERIKLEVLSSETMEFYEKEAVQEIFDRLEAEISSLPKRTQEVIRLQLAGYSSSEIAEILSLGQESVKTLKKYGIAKLKSAMNGLDWMWFTHYQDFSA